MLKELLKRVRQYRTMAVLTPLFMIGEVAMEVLIPTIMAAIIDVGVANGDVSYIVKASLLLILSAVLSMVFGLLGAWSGSYASSGFASNLRSDLFGKVQDFSFCDIDRFSTSSLITRMTTDVQNVQQSFQMMIRICFRAPVMLIFAMIMVYHNGGAMSLVFAVALPVLAIGIAFVLKTTFRYFTNAFRGYDRLNRTVQENLNGIRAVKAYVREEQQTEKFEEDSGYIRDNFEKAQRIMAMTNPLMMAVSYLCMIIISYLGARFISIGNMATGELLSIYTYTQQILSSLISVGMIIVMLSISRASMQRICEVLVSRPSMDTNPDGIRDVRNGDIEFRDVSFGYKEGSTVLSHVNLRIRSGEMVGILGTTGSGKSTLISLIARLYDATEGQVLVGDRDVREYSLEALRSQVSVVLQKNQLFSGTIEENLRWGNENASEEEIRWALDVSASSSFVNAKEDGIKSHVEQGGSNFSGGQKQRLCIARALLKKPRILIMDDSTSAVDTATDASIRRALKEDVKDLTKIIISQRVSSVEGADQIIMMDNGRIEDVGTHEELLGRNESYRTLYETQMKGAIDA